MWFPGRRSRQPGFGRCLAVMLLAYLLLLGLTVHLWQVHPHGIHRTIQGLQLSGSTEASPLRVLDARDPQPGRGASLLAALLRSSSQMDKHKLYTDGTEAGTEGGHADRGAAEVGSKVKDSMQPTVLTADTGQGKGSVHSPSNDQGTSHVHPIWPKAAMEDGGLEVSFHQVGSVYVYGAYLDSRSGDRAHIRLLVLRPRHTDSPGLTCTFPLPPAWEKTWGVKKALEVLAVRVDSRGATVHAVRYELCENHGKKYGGWIYSCVIPPGLPSPSHVILEPVPPTTRGNSSENILNAWGDGVDATKPNGSIQAMPHLNADASSKHSMEQTQSEEAPSPSIETASPDGGAVGDSDNARTSQPTFSDSERGPSKTYLSRRDNVQSLMKYLASKTAKGPSNYNTSNPKQAPTSPDMLLQKSTPQNMSSQHIQAGNSTGIQSIHTEAPAAPLSMSLSFLTAAAGQKLSVGVCVPPLWGHVSVPHLIQYVELSRLLGASQVIFYQYNVSDTIARLLQFLTKRGDVTVVGWHPPREVIGGGGLWYEGQTLAVQHCLYTFMPRFQYLAFFDLDEVLVPKHHETWQELLQALVSKSDSTQRQQFRDGHSSSNRHRLEVQKTHHHGGSMLLSDLKKFDNNNEKGGNGDVYKQSILRQKIPKEVVFTGIHKVTKEKLQHDMEHTRLSLTESVEKMPPTGETIQAVSNEKSTSTEVTSKRKLSVMTQGDEIKETRQNLVAAFSFQSAFFDPRQLPEPSQRMPFMQALQRTQHASAVRSKVIVEPQRVFEMGIHHVSSLLSQNASVLRVDQSEALLHHYRPCVVTFDPNMACFPTVTDDSLLRYSSELEEKVHRTTREFLLQFQRFQGRS